MHGYNTYLLQIYFSFCEVGETVSHNGFLWSNIRNIHRILSIDLNKNGAPSSPRGRMVALLDNFLITTIDGKRGLLWLMECNQLWWKMHGNRSLRLPVTRRQIVSTCVGTGLFQRLFVMTYVSQLGPASQMSTTSSDSSISWETSVGTHEPVGNSSWANHNSGPHVVEYSVHLFYVTDLLYFIEAKVGHAILQSFLL